MTLDEHLGYVSDSIRLARYQAAIAKVVAKGSTVADLGSGSGVLGLLCLQAGLGHVDAIDYSCHRSRAPIPDQAAGANKASFIRGNPSRWNCPSPWTSSSVTTSVTSVSTTA